MPPPPESAGDAVSLPGPLPAAPAPVGLSPVDLPLGPPLAPVPFTLLLDEAMRWTRRYLRAIFPTIAVPVLVLAAGLVAVQLFWMTPEGTRGTDLLHWLARLYSGLAVSLPFSLLLDVLYAAMTVAAVDAVAGRAVDIRRALRFVVRPRVLGTLLLVFVLDMAALLLCGLAALYVWPLLGLTVPVMADEGVTGAAALRRSIQLARHNPRRRFLTNPMVKILALILVVWVVSYLVGIMMQLPVLLVQGAVFIRQAAGGETVPRWLSSLLWLRPPLECLSTVAVTAVYLYRSFALALLFFDLRARREGDDLRLAIAGMTGAGTEPSPPSPLPPLALPPLVTPRASGAKGPFETFEPPEVSGPSESSGPSEPPRWPPSAPERPQL